MTLWRPWPVLCIALLMASACGAAEQTPATAPGTKPEPVASAKQRPSPARAEAPRAPDGTPSVRLLEPGKQPRAPLRYTPASPQRETLVMAMQMNLAMGSPDLPGEPVGLPGTTMRLNVSVDSVAPNGDISYRFELTTVEVEAAQHAPEVVSQIDAATRKLIGMGGRVTLSSRGLVRKMTMNVPERVDPTTRELLAELERSMSQMCDPLPEEAIGVGARWDVQTRYSLRGLQIDQVRRYSLVERKGDSAGMKFIVEQTAKPQQMTLPNAPPGAVVRLVQLASAGDGTVAIDSQKLIPRSSKMNLKTTSIIDVDSGAKKGTMRTDMAIEVALSPAALK